MEYCSYTNTMYTLAGSDTAAEDQSILYIVDGLNLQTKPVET